MAEVRSWDVAVERGLIDLRAPFRDVQLELLNLLRRLPRDGWSAPTVLPDWDVHSVALHLLGGDIGRLSGAWSGSRAGFDVDFGQLAAGIESSNEEWVRAVRRIPPPLAVDLLQVTADRVTGLYAEADLWAPATPVAWTGTGPSPLWLDVAREYTERWVHQAQIREAVGAPLLEDRPWLWPVLDVFMLCLPRAYEGVEAPRGTVVVVDLGGQAGGTWGLVRGDERWHLDTDVVASAAARLSLSTDHAWRWLGGLMSPSALELSVSTEGHHALWKPALRAVAVMSTGPSGPAPRSR